MYQDDMEGFGEDERGLPPKARTVFLETFKEAERKTGDASSALDVAWKAMCAMGFLPPNKELRKPKRPPPVSDYDEDDE
jgi:hypothetical protein